jgi:hypothetical protein
VNTRVSKPLLYVSVLFAIGVGGPTAVDVNAAELRGDTLDAFNRYVSATEERMDREGRGSGPFLWIDRLSDSERLDALTRLKGGEIVVTRAASRDATGHSDVPHGLIHHWIGTVFVPGATVDHAVSLMQDYGRYQEIYSPNVRRSRTISREGDRFKVYLQLFMSKVISVVLNTEYDVRYTQVSPTRVIVRSYSTRIAEVHDPGAAREKEAAPGDDSGFLWRFYAYWSFEERAEGTYIQCESVSLSRGVPVGLGWIVGPFVTSIPRESLSFTLERIRMNLSSTALPAVSSLRSDRGRR